MTAKYLNRLAALAAALLCTTACIYPFEVELSKTGEWPLVIDGDILIGATTVLNLSHVRPFNADPDELQHFSASGYIEGEDGTKVESSGYGFYVQIAPEVAISFDTSKLRPDQRYRLHLTTYGDRLEPLNTYESDWLTPCSAPTIDNLSYSNHPENNQLWIGLSMNCPGEHYFRWSFTETWEYHSDIHSSLEYVPWHFDERKGYTAEYRYADPDLYYCWSTVSSPQINIFSTINQTEDRFEDLAFHVIRLNDKRLQVLYRITVQLQAISEDAYNYWHTIQENSEGQGSIFSPTPSQTASNVHCTSDPALGVIGYLNAAVPAISVLYYDNAVEHYYKPDKPYLSQLDTLKANDFYMADRIYAAGKLPSYGLYLDMASGSPTHYVWDNAICIDCRRQGGTKSKPNDWPNDHK